MENQAIADKKTFQEEKRRKVAKPLLWTGMMSIVMFFAGLTSAVIISNGDGNWIHYEIPSMFLWSCIVIAISSVTIIIANVSAKKDNISLTKVMVGITLLLGFVFIYTQYAGAATLYNQGIFFTGAKQNPAGSYFYLLAFVHLLHLAGGIIALIVTFFNALKGRYNSKNLLGLQVCSMYWHFLGGMWIYLYVFFRMII